MRPVVDSPIAEVVCIVESYIQSAEDMAPMHDALGTREMCYESAKK